MFDNVSVSLRACFRTLCTRHAAKTIKHKRARTQAGTTAVATTSDTSEVVRANANGTVVVVVLVDEVEVTDVIVWVDVVVEVAVVLV